MATTEIVRPSGIAEDAAQLCCPGCGSPKVVRSQRIDWQEKLECWLRRVLPYRCRKCDLRFFARKLAN